MNTKQKFATLALMGLTAIAAAPVTAAQPTNSAQGTYLAAGCGGGCSGRRGYVAEEPTNTKPVNTSGPRTAQQPVDLEPPTYQQYQQNQQQGQYYQQAPSNSGCQSRPQAAGYAPQQQRSGCNARGQTAQSSCNAPSKYNR